MPLAPGLYDQPVTVGLGEQLERVASELIRVDDADAGESAEAFARILNERLVEAQVALISELLSRIGDAARGVVASDDPLAPPGRMLQAKLAAG